MGVADDTRVGVTRPPNCMFPVKLVDDISVRLVDDISIGLVGDTSVGVADDTCVRFANDISVDGIICGSNSGGPSCPSKSSHSRLSHSSS